MAKSSKETPLIRQYNQIKQANPDAVLLFRLGDFFETFNEDAKIAAEVCGITLTKRNNGAAGEMPLAGFPHHQLDNYLPKLVRAGYRVAVCEQVEDPKQAKGIVKRAVTEVVTPGVALYDKILDSKRNNFIASIFSFKPKKGIEIFGISHADISTGEFFLTEVSANKVIEVLESISPSEIIINRDDFNDIKQILDRLSYDISITKLDEWIFEKEYAYESLNNQFNSKTLKGFGIEDLQIGQIAASAIIHYISQTQKSKLPQFRSISYLNQSDYMILDHPTRRNLEIVMQGTSKDSSLFGVIDKTVTPMGSRLLKSWITKPLIKKHKILERQGLVSKFHQESTLLEEFREKISKINDLERINVKVATARANPRDLISLKNSLMILPDLNLLLGSLAIDFKFEELIELCEMLENSLLEEAPTNVGNGNVFKTGFNLELDEYLEAKYSGKNWINEYQTKLRIDTGISSLKVGFNNVFGYYIEVTKVHSDKVPEDFERKQTLTNSERYISTELKGFEEKILSAEDKIHSLENRLYEKLLERIFTFYSELKSNSKNIAYFDVIQSLAQLAILENYKKPIFVEENILQIKEGRHPVVEKNLDIGESFTANDLDISDNSFLHIITGPNMSGKSCYLRQNALIVLLAQIGSYVPADEVKLKVVDRIFTRVGAQDNITLGESTFLVEMQETANILNNCTADSLVLLDEVGRGTATFDGLSIAWALSEYLHENKRSKTLFATHYHELNDLENRYEGICNYRVEVIESKTNIIFTHKLKKGGSDHSFGIHVAKMAGLPKNLTDRSNEILKTFESKSDQQELIESKTSKPNIQDIKSMEGNENNQMAIFSFEDDVIRKELKEININNLTPLESMQILSELINKVKN